MLWNLDSRQPRSNNALAISTGLIGSSHCITCAQRGGIFASLSPIEFEGHTAVRQRARSREGHPSFQVDMVHGPVQAPSVATTVLRHRSAWDQASLYRAPDAPPCGMLSRA